MSAALVLPPLGFGAAQLGNLYRVTSDEEAAGAVTAAWEGGIRYFDTAPHYGIGTSERRLGALLQQFPREEYLLSTKVGRLLRPGPGTGDDMAHSFAVPDDHVREWDFSEAGIRRSHAESLERLGLDRVDILLAHDPEEGPTEQAFAEGLPALARMREEGLVRAVGVGSKDADVLTRAVRTGLIDLVMLSGRYTLLEQAASRELLAECERRGVGVIAVSVFNSGLLSRHRGAGRRDLRVRAGPGGDAAAGAGARRARRAPRRDPARSRRAVPAAASGRALGRPRDAHRRAGHARTWSGWRRGSPRRPGPTSRGSSARRRAESARRLMASSRRARRTCRPARRRPEGAPMPPAEPRPGPDPALGPVTDAHLHLWDLAESDYAWLAGAPEPLRRTVVRRRRARGAARPRRDPRDPRPGR
jgi:aryl-alcohol dehydrogenase-like predicted oxidoreductase